jgi:hypothetical protein
MKGWSLERRRAFVWIAMVVTVLILLTFAAGAVRAEEPAALISALKVTAEILNIGYDIFTSCGELATRVGAGTRRLFDNLTINPAK